MVVLDHADVRTSYLGHGLCGRSAAATSSAPINPTQSVGLYVRASCAPRTQASVAVSIVPFHAE